jgi:hypothetical protein
VAVFLYIIAILATSQKESKKLYLTILGKIKTCNSIKIGHILCIENKIVKDFMNAFLN